MSEEKPNKPTLRYKGGGAKQDSDPKQIDPESVGFGDLVNDGSKSKLETTRQSLSKTTDATRSSLSKLSLTVRNTARSIDLGAIKTSAVSRVQSLTQRKKAKPESSAKPTYRQHPPAGVINSDIATQTKPKKEPKRTKSKPKKDRISLPFSLPSGEIITKIKQVDRRVLAGVALLIIAVVPLSIVLRDSSDSGPQVRGDTEVITVTGEGANFESVFPQGLDDQTSEPFVDDARGLISYQTSNQYGDFIVTQQALPDEFKENPENIKNLALSLSEKTSINRFETDKGIVHVVEAADQSQTMLFSFEDKLIFVTSPDPLDIDTWVVFINSLG